MNTLLKLAQIELNSSDTETAVGYILEYLKNQEEKDQNKETNTKNLYVVAIKCLVNGKANAETERRNIFASCKDDLGLNILYSDIEPANKLDLEVAKNMGIL